MFERWRPDVLVREFAENGSTFAGESAGVPVVCAAWAALPFDADSWRDTVDWDRLVSCYAAVRRELGLAADEPGGAWRRQLTLTPLPPSWLRGDDRAAGVQHIRVPLAEAPASAAPPWLEAFGRDRPFVYATLGTVFNKMRRLRTAILDAVADIDADVLMTVGRDVDPATVGNVPANVRIEPFIAQSLVMPRASLVISHAGLGTMLGAIYQGVPMIVIAIAADQPVNARRAAELGVGVAFHAREVTASLIRDAAADALRNADLRSTALALRDECNSMAPVQEAVATLEQVVQAARSDD